MNVVGTYRLGGRKRPGSSVQDVLSCLAKMSRLLFICTAPLLGAALLLVIPSWNTSGLRKIALGSSCVTLLMTILLWISFDFALLRPQFTWFSAQPWLDITLALDGLSLLFMVLTAFTLPICLLLGWRTSYVKEYCLAFLILEFLLFAVFCSFDVFLFYVFFEGVLIPMFLIIG